MNLAAIKLLKSCKFTTKAIILDNDILILVEKVVDFEFEFRNSNFFATELIFEFDKFVFELDSEFALIIEIIFKLLFCLFELFSLVF